MLNKETFHKKWYYRLLQIVFWGSFIFFILLGVLGILYEDDMPFIGFFWAGIIVGVYWFMKRIIYYIFFKEKINKDNFSS